MIEEPAISVKNNGVIFSFAFKISKVPLKAVNCKVTLICLIAQLNRSVM